MLGKQRVLFITEAMGGGVFTYIVDLANELINEFDIYIAYGTRPQTPLNYKTYFDSRIHLIEVKNFSRAVCLRRDVKAFSEIRQIAKTINPDIIHLHSSKAGALGRFAFNGKKVKLFYTPHGYSFLMKNYSPAKRCLFKFVERVCACRRCKIISCGYGEHLESLKLTKNADYINNGINIKELEELIYNTKIKKNDKFTVYTLGRICYQKNPALFNKIAISMPEIDFLWIGDGELRDELTAPNIKITGWIDRNDALKYSLSSDVFVLTSLWEGLPISLLESMYMKKICIVNNVIGSRDVIDDSINGFVCEAPEDFITAIRKAKNSDCRVLTEKAFYDVKNKYNTQIMAENYKIMYKKER